jgi:hypothetical protein
MHVLLVPDSTKLLLVMLASPEFHAAAIKSMFQQLTLVDNAHLDNLLMLIMEDVPNSLLVATLKD